MDDPQTPVKCLAGFLLGAHPQLLDPNFKETVVLLSAHSVDDGALGVIINRPTGETLGTLRRELRTPLLQNLAVYEGGPVATNEILLAAWSWDLSQQSFRLYFGLEPAALQELVDSDPKIEARAFLGYSGWSGGQLESELSRADWAIGPFVHPCGKMPPQNLWRGLLNAVRPEWGIMMDFPDDPSIN